jgi:Ca2+-binding EF-hand superfamily protein
MRSFLCAAIVLLMASTAVAQFGNNPPADPPAEGEPPQAGEPAEPADPADPAADAGGGGNAASSQIFTTLDADGDGVISKLELRKAVTALKKLDADGDGNITMAECGAMAAAGGAAAAGGEQNQWLERIMASDKNGDGRLTADEVPDTIKPMLQGADQNNDGAIDRRELMGAMDRGRNAGPGNGRFTPDGAAALGGGRGNENMGRFMQYDANGDGRLSVNELPRQAVAMLQGGDQNGDGAIDARELQIISEKMNDRMRAYNAGDPNAKGGDRFNKRPRNNEK